MSVKRVQWVEKAAPWGGVPQRALLTGLLLVSAQVLSACSADSGSTSHAQDSGSTSELGTVNPQPAADAATGAPAASDSEGEEQNLGPDAARPGDVEAGSAPGAGDGGNAETSAPVDASTTDATDASHPTNTDSTSGDPTAEGGAGSHPDAAVDATETTPDTGQDCQVQVSQVPNAGATHVAAGSEIAYAHNPPTSGDHYPAWAAFQRYTAAVPRGYWVHNLEHGGIVFLVGPSASEELVAELEQVFLDLPEDPSCGHPRALFTPDPELESPLAVVAWDWVLQADCVSPSAIEDFALAHRAMGREDVCSDGAFVAP